MSDVYYSLKLIITATLVHQLIYNIVDIIIISRQNSVIL